MGEIDTEALSTQILRQQLAELDVVIDDEEPRAHRALSDLRHLTCRCP
jgi:hypothetical protein